MRLTLTAVRPDWDEVIPLVGVIANGFLEGADDFLGELLADFALAQGGAVVGDLWQDVSGVARAVIGQINGQQDAP